MSMTIQQGIVFAIIAFAMIMFVWNKVRYDLVGVMALLAAVLAGVVKADHAFEGFAHPAVITVAAVLVISQALQNSGLVDKLVVLLSGSRKSPTLQVAAGSGIAAALSCVMNNVGALALMLPVALRNAYKSGRSPSIFLIPLSFASLLGGLVTLIGTPPNIVISGFRETQTGTPFSMFDFAPVGLAVAVAGLLYLTFIGWRLLPERISVDGDDDDLFHVERYTLESNVPEGSPLVGMRVRELENKFDREVSVVAIIRNGVRRLAPRAIEKVRNRDVLILQGDPGLITPLADGVQLGELGHQVEGGAALVSDDIEVIEAVVLPNSPIEGKSMRQYRMHDRLGINLLAVARQGRQPTARLKNIRFKTGDVLLLQGEKNGMAEALHTLGCLRLADRAISEDVPSGKILLSTGIFGAAIAAAAFGLVTAPIAFTAAVLLLVLTDTISLNEVYESIEWPVILLLGTLIPIGEALQRTGGTDLIATGLLDVTAGLPVWAILALMLAVSMWMSDFVHNTPTAILMAPIAMGIATGLGANPDTFLMAVAVGAASPYLTPIGHQSNTLVMGPGGYKFQDYALVGFPLQIIILLVAVPMILWTWPPMQ
jgi:di/tricarboxylate transporter